MVFGSHSAHGNAPLTVMGDLLPYAVLILLDEPGAKASSVKSKNREQVGSRMSKLQCSPGQEGAWLTVGRVGVYSVEIQLYENKQRRFLTA